MNRLSQWSPINFLFQLITLAPNKWAACRSVPPRHVPKPPQSPSSPTAAPHNNNNSRQPPHTLSSQKKKILRPQSQMSEQIAILSVQQIVASPLSDWLHVNTLRVYQMPKHQTAGDKAAIRRGHCDVRPRTMPSALPSNLPGMCTRTFFDFRVFTALAHDVEKPSQVHRAGVVCARHIEPNEEASLLNQSPEHLEEDVACLLYFLKSFYCY